MYRCENFVSFSFARTALSHLHTNCFLIFTKRAPQVYEAWASRKDVQEKLVEVPDPNVVVDENLEEDPLAKEPPKKSMHPVDKPMSDFWPGQGESTEGGTKDKKPLYHEAERK